MKATTELLNQLHDLVCKDLIAKIESGKASAQELAAAIKFLKDNHIEGDLLENPNLQNLKKTVFPVFNDEDEYN